MPNINEIKETLKNFPHAELMQEYEMRQKKEKEKNLIEAKKVNEILGVGSNFSPFNEITNLGIAISSIKKSNDYYSIIELKKLLDVFHYNYQQEILVCSQYIDHLETGDYSKEIFDILLRGLLSIRGISKSDSTFTLKTYFGPINITNPLNNIDPNLRRGYCHNITAEYLLNHPNCYGAYFYIPLQFKGYLEHSVIIDYDNNQVLDLTNNNALSLTTWKQLYPRCSFVISGQDFQEIYYTLLNDLGISAQMATLEEVKLTRRKNKG